MLRPPIAATAVFIALAGSLAGQAPAPRIHRLEATPTTVAYGYYWAEAKPVLRIASGDIIDVDTLLTNTPTGLQRAGVPPEKIQETKPDNVLILPWNLKEEIVSQLAYIREWNGKCVVPIPDVEVL